MRVYQFRHLGISECKISNFFSCGKRFFEKKLKKHYFFSENSKNSKNSESSENSEDSEVFEVFENSENLEEMDRARLVPTGVNYRKGLEHGGGALHGGDKPANLVEGIIDRKRGADHALHPIARHERLGAMMPRAHGDAHAVEQ